MRATSVAAMVTTVAIDASQDAVERHGILFDMYSVFSENNSLSYTPENDFSDPVQFPATA